VVNSTNNSFLSPSSTLEKDIINKINMSTEIAPNKEAAADFEYPSVEDLQEDLP